MIRLGEKQILRVIKKVEFGVYLADAAEGAEAEERVLLPKKQVPAGTACGDELEVFVYRDSADRLISTVKEPLLKLGEVARLRVAQVNQYGAFLDWGLEKDLFLPYRQQTCRVKEEDWVLAALYIDKSGRLCATMNVYPWLSTDSPYRKDDRVSGYVYETSPEFGMFVAVDDRYSALIPKKELYGEVRVGDRIEARVAAVREDGKLDLSIREKAYLQIEADAKRVMELLDSYEGVLPFNDKASPEVIRREMQMSKNEFKRAVGHLLKSGSITIGEKTIRRV